MKPKSNNETASESAKGLPNKVPARDILTISHPGQLDATKIRGFDDEDQWDGVPDVLPPNDCNCLDSPERWRLEEEYLDELEREAHLVETHEDQSIQDHEHDKHGSDPSSEQLAAVKAGLRRIANAKKQRNEEEE